MKEEGIIPNSANLRANLFALGISIVSLFFLLYAYSVPLVNPTKPIPRNNTNEIEIQWSVQQIQEPEKDSRRFVEANPNSAINPPDSTENFSFRDQQAAQPVLSKEKDNNSMPKTNGLEYSSKISPSSKESPTSSKITKQSQEKQKKSEIQEVPKKSPQAKKRSPDEQKIDPTNKDGLAVEKSENEGLEKVIDLTNKEQVSKKKKNIAMNQSNPMASISTRPRPKLSPDLLRGPVMKTVSSAPRVGVLAIECRLHPYGVYVQEMLRSIEDQWHHLAIGSLRFLQKDKLKSKITYRFSLKADGTIEDLSLMSDGGPSLPAELCRQAIASRVPYGEWTQQMMDDFGKTDEITIHFNYR